MREILEALLTREGYQVRLASSGQEGLDLARSMTFDAAILDVMMPGIDGITALEELRKFDDDLPVIMITAFASVENAIGAMKRGAFDYITKPFKNDEVHRGSQERGRAPDARGREPRTEAEPPGAVPQVRQHHRQEPEDAAGVRPDHPGGAQPVDGAGVRRERHRQGARGARVAHELHPSGEAVHHGELGKPPAGPARIEPVRPRERGLHGRGVPKKGLFELADKGSIFFDEIGNVPLETQAKLLRVIQEREFMRLGGIETIKVDVRIIAATNVDLKKMMEDSRFREDLYYRLHVITVALPPLRDRKEDVPLLAQHFLEKYGDENAKSGMELSSEALDLLVEYDWPGNVRELENVIERAVVLSSSNRVGIDLIPDHVRATRPFHIPTINVPPEGISFKDVVGDFERRLIESTLEAAGGVQKRAAELLHIKPTTLNEMIKRYDIRPRRSKRLEEGAGAAAEPTASGVPPATPSRQTPTGRT